MQVKNLTETSRSFSVLVEHKGREQVVNIRREVKKTGTRVWESTSAGYVTTEIKNFLVDVIDGYIETGEILKGRREAAYTESERRCWVCPHCGMNNITNKVEQGYPLPMCQNEACEEQSDWGKEGA